MPILVDSKAVAKGFPIKGGGAVKTKWMIDTYGLAINKALAGSGIFWALAVAQFCEESFYGASEKAQQFNNFGGIRNMPGKAVGKSPTGWAIFATPEDCFVTYINNVLKDQTKLYIKKGLLTAKTPYEQLKAVAEGGYYGTSKADAQLYIKTIGRHLDRVLLMYPQGKIS
jgi:hypothetical protein